MAEFLLRLRADSTRIHDLAGNTISENGTFTFTNAGKFGGKSITFDGANDLSFNIQDSINSNEDYTISFWMKVVSTLNDLAGIIGNYSPGDLSIGDWSIYYSSSTGDYLISTARSSTNSGIPASFGVNSATPDSEWHHYAKVRHNGRSKLYMDGSVVTTDISRNPGVVDSSGSYADDCTLSNIKPVYIGKQLRYEVNLIGQLDDICIIKGEALWTEDFTPPTDYLKLPTYAYLLSNNLYTGASLTNLTNNWSGLTNAEKEALVPSFSEKIPSIQDLAIISPFRVLTDDTSLSNVKVTGQPKPQIIEPTSLINTGAVSTVQSINITNTITDVTVKFAITTDLTTYKVYDATQGDWVTSTNIEEDGMSIAQINALTPEILALLDVSNGIAFKQCFIATSENASVELSEISAVVDIDGSWNQSVHGTDYSVTYPNKTTMSVRLLTNGDYIINYPISSNS